MFYLLWLNVQLGMYCTNAQIYLGSCWSGMSYLATAKCTMSLPIYCFFYVSYRYRVYFACSWRFCTSFWYYWHLKVSRILTALLTWSNCQTHWSLPHILSQPKFPLTSFESLIRQSNLNESVSIFNHHKHMSSSCPLLSNSCVCPERITLKNKVWTDFKMRLPLIRLSRYLRFCFRDRFNLHTSKKHQSH